MCLLLLTVVGQLGVHGQIQRHAPYPVVAEPKPKQQLAPAPTLLHPMVEPHVLDRPLQHNQLPVTPPHALALTVLLIIPLAQPVHRDTA